MAKKKTAEEIQIEGYKKEMHLWQMGINLELQSIDNSIKDSLNSIAIEKRLLANSKERRKAIIARRNSAMKDYNKWLAAQSKQKK